MCVCVPRKTFVITHIKLLMVSFAQGTRIGRGGMKKRALYYLLHLFLGYLIFL